MVAVPVESPAKVKESKVRLDHETRREQILEAAARLICQKGFGQASMSDLAAEMGMTKAGIYHHIVSKDELLFEIMSYALDLFEEKVLDRVEKIRDPVERVRATIRGYVLLITRDRPKELTVVLHESNALTGEYREKIERRKRRYVRFLERTYRELVREGLARDIDPRVVTFATLGMINWIYQWYRPGGRVEDTDLSEALIELLLNGLLLDPEQASSNGETRARGDAPARSLADRKRRGLWTERTVKSAKPRER